MFAYRRVTQSLCCVALLGIIASPVLSAQPTVAAKKQKIFDVKLTEENRLQGQVVTAAGAPEANVRVILSQEKTGFRAQTKTDSKGRFAMTVKRSGAYRVLVGKRSFTIRVWRAKVAPPTSKSGLLCVTGGTTVRGQLLGTGGTSPMVGFLSNPLVIGAAIATAIAVPVAVDDDDDEAGFAGGGGAGEPAS